MTRIPQKERDKIEQAIYLPMVLTILERDLVLFQKGPFKLSKPYIEWIELTLGKVQKELSEATGIDQSDISKIERGVANPSIATLGRIAQALDAQLTVSIV